MECENIMQMEHTKILTRLQVKVEALEVAVSDLSSIKETLVKLTYISEQSMEFNRMQQKSNRQIEESLGKINENLGQLNRRVSGLEKHDEEEELDKDELEAEKCRERNERYKAKIAFYGVLVTGVLAIIGILLS